jgi:hypothetical protein
MIRSIVALLSSLLVAVQVYLLATGKNQLCFNDGCGLVDSLIRIAPVYFNIVGLLFFQTLFWCFLFGRNGSEYWHKFARLVLLCGVAAEGVLVFFQYRIAATYCSYCLLVFGCVVLLTILSGLKQLFRSTLIFVTIILVSLTLQYGSGVAPASLVKGSLAFTGEADAVPQRFLFFSGTCPHCEEVLETLRKQNSCSVYFNPVDRKTAISFPGARPLSDADAESNMAFLRQLSIEEVPVLVIVDQQSLHVLQGAARIREYLTENCQPVEKSDYGGMSMSVAPESQVPTGAASDDGCSFAENCQQSPVPPVSQ